VIEGETHRWRGWWVADGGLWVEEYQWTMGKLEEVATWLEEDGGESSMASSSSRWKRTG
jgi:hypothetical protein